MAEAGVEALASPQECFLPHFTGLRLRALRRLGEIARLQRLAPAPRCDSHETER
jgi:hypothetical protein